MKTINIKYILIGYTIVQFFILIYFGYTPYPDSQGYIHCAQEALEFREFYPAKEQLYTLPFLWNIGAINAVALSLKVFNSIWPLLGIYTVLKSCSLLLTFLIAKKWLGQKTAFISTIIYILYPANYGETTSVLSEVPFVFFILASIYAAINKKYLLGGSLMGCADYFRPIAIIFILAFILSNIKNYKGCLKLVLSYIIFINIICIGNYMFKGQYIYKAKTGWMALAQYHWLDTKPQGSIEPMALANNHHLTYTQKNEAWKHIFLKWLKKHPKEYIKQIPIKLGKTYISDNINMCTFLEKQEKYSHYMYGRLSLPSLIKSFPQYSFAQVLAILNLIIYYLILIAFICSIKYIKTLSLSWFIVIIGTLFIVLVSHGEARFHIPFMPFIIISSAYSIYKFIVNKKLTE